MQNVKNKKFKKLKKKKKKKAIFKVSLSMERIHQL